MHRNQPQLGIPKFLNIRFISLLLTIMGIAMIIGGLLVIVADRVLPTNADAARSTWFFAIQNVDQTFGFPLSTNDMISNSITSVGIATSIIGLTLLVLREGLRAKKKSALWIAIIIFALATFFDMVAFLYQGLLGAPASAPGAIINGLMLYVLLRDRELFTRTSPK